MQNCFLNDKLESVDPMQAGQLHLCLCAQWACEVPIRMHCCSLVCTVAWCTQNMFEGLKRDHHLKHTGRQQLGNFLKVSCFAHGQQFCMSGYHKAQPPESQKLHTSTIAVGAADAKH